MDLIVSLPAFAVAVLLISASPGPAMALIFRRAALHGPGAAVPTVLGLELGLYLWALFAAAGLAALVAASEVAYVALRVVGAAFLIFLGIRAWRTAWHDRRAGMAAEAATPDAPMSGTVAVGTLGAGAVGVGAVGVGAVAGRRKWWKAFGEGTMVMLANPKAAAFMIAFYPQFVPAGRHLFATTALLAALQVIIETVFYLALAFAVGRAVAWFRRPRIRRRLEAVTGTVLIALGFSMAVRANE